MKQLAFFLLVQFVFSSCQEHKIDEIIIEGNVKNIPEGKIYLVEAHRWKIPIDSTICANGHFVFKITPDSAFIPYMASINFSDSTKSSKVKSLLFRNFTLGADSMKQSTNAFYVEKGITRIEGDNETKPYLRVFGGKETEVMFKNMHNDFGWLGNIDSLKRISRIESFKKEIIKYPSSYFLLKSIFNAKEQYSEKEMSEILSLFTEDVRKSSQGEKIRSYLKNRPDPGQPYSNLLLLNSLNQRVYIIDTNAKLNILVFWASWCGPCRKEIPFLKKLYKKYRIFGLNLVSISIDDNQDNWKKALSEEKMNWPQFLVGKEKIEEIKQQFNFSAIPLIVFTDKNGSEIVKFIGYSEEIQSAYDSVLFKHLK